MGHQAGLDVDAPGREHPTDAAWRTVIAAARYAEHLETANRPGTFAASADGQLVPVSPGHSDALLAWQPGTGWQLLLPPTDSRHALIDLYLPVCGATTSRPITVGHLGQSLDGFIATNSGDSQYVTGQDNIRHLHRMRALCDAVVVGAGTIAADDPQLTTRLVDGPSPLRVVLDPARRLAEHYRVFVDRAAETLYVCGRSMRRPDESHFGLASMVEVDDGPAGLDVSQVLGLLRARGCHRIFVEGGGVTVSMFLEANLLDRLQMAVAPLIIGNGRPAIRVRPRAALRDCLRPGYRVFRMGGDILFDCDLRQKPSHDSDYSVDGEPLITRVI